MPRSSPSSKTVATPDWALLRPEITDDLLRSLTDRIVDAFHPETVTLFGSCAYGEADMNSDLDLFVVLRTSEPPARRIARVSEVARVPFLPMDLLVYTPDEVAARLQEGDPFVEDIVTHGKVLYPRESRR